LLALGIAILLGASAAGARAETAGFAFLQVPAGARASAMGGAYASVAEGVEGMWWNPAALATTRGIQLAAGHVEFIEGLRHEQFAVGGRLFGGGVAASLRAMYSESIESRDDLGNPLGSFGSHDLDFGLGYARSLGGGIDAGGSVHFVRERIANASTDTWTFGMGAGWSPTAVPGLRVGLAAENLGADPHYDIDGVAGAPVPLPSSVQGGASYRMGLGDHWTLLGSAEGRLSRGRTGAALGGIELASRYGGALRLGWRGSEESASFGTGAGWKIGSVGVDYAYVPYRLDLGDTHRLSLLAQF
jgi:hypothetical protein